ncbi:hypothetical protein [Streptomyces sp. BRB081]|uniref:hypothetical protein n=1 Tax=Streptomyces sp. BRB081 TaxID=2769544 RepID=UPI0018ACEC59|nr:hypothetical protein [Streptomyces sp. BRB081]MBL3806131.1 hypothetical protein [Streptomyces sp. BRB081]
MRTQDGSTQETGRREGLRITVVYTGMGDPEVHAAGCADIARTMKTRGVSSEELDAADARAVSAHVYADQIDEGGCLYVLRQGVPVRFGVVQGCCGYAASSTSFGVRDW